MLELTVKDYAKRTGVSEQAVRKQIKNNKLRTNKKALDGRLTTLISIEEVEQHNTTFTQPIEQNNPLQTSSMLNNDNPAQYNEFLNLIKNMYTETVKLNEKNLQLAELAGQTKLLTDSEHRTQQTCIILGQEKQALIEERAQLKAQLDLKNQQLEDFKQKLETKESKVNSWWSKL